MAILHLLLFCHSGLDPESIFFQSLTVLDAGSVIPDLIRDRHDGQKLVAFLNCDTLWKTGIQKISVLW